MGQGGPCSVVQDTATADACWQACFYGVVISAELKAKSQAEFGAKLQASPKIASRQGLM